MSKKSDEHPFWKTKSLIEMTHEEWESLCDGCGRCCLNKLEDEDTGEIACTDIACTLLDHETCRCTNYDNRFKFVPDCLPLTPDSVEEISWLPPTCAYKILQDGNDLPAWHPLVSGDPASVHSAGISVRGQIVSEDDFSVEEYEERIVAWPREGPQDWQTRS